jgi:hypothetical protein
MRFTHQICFTVFALGTIAATAMAENTAREIEEATAADLQPFTRIAWLPASADLSSIKFEGIKTVKVATKLLSTANLRYCEERAATEPGGSLYCPAITHDSPVQAIQVVYSFQDQPMASDEYGGTYNTFSVYFRLEEVSSELRHALSSGKVARTAASENLRVTTSRDSVSGSTIDKANSTFCPGNYVDGNWIHMNPICQERLAYRVVPGYSPYITVRIDVASDKTVALRREATRE